MTVNDAGRRAALGERLRRWTDAGLISPAQADAIERWEAGRGDPPTTDQVTPAPGRPGPSLTVEALAYVGGAVIAAALTVVTVGYWDRMSHATQLVIPAAATAVTLVAGLMVPRRWGDVGVRIRAALWLVGVIGLFAVMIVINEMLAERSTPPMMLVAGPVFALAALLWLLHRASAQHLAAFVSATMLGAALLDLGVDLPGATTGLVIAAVSVVWGGLAYAGMLPGCGRWAVPAGVGDRAVRTERQRRWGAGMGAVGAVVGSVVLSAGGQVPWLGVIPVAVVVAAGVARGDLLVLIVGAVGTVIVLPMIGDHYLASTLATALVLLAVGAAMVALAVMVARRQAKRHTRSAATTPAAEGSAHTETGPSYSR